MASYDTYSVKTNKTYNKEKHSNVNIVYDIQYLSKVDTSFKGLT
jgi:hypothetical protein